MEAYKFKFTAKRLRAVPERYLSFLIASGHCCNELIILMPYIIFEHDPQRANRVEAALILTRRFTIDRILVSKIVEYGEMCSKFFEDADKSEEGLLRELASEYAPIADAIAAAKWARIMRNKISFHYDLQHGLAALEELDDEHTLELTAGLMKGITLFDFAEELAIRPVFAKAGNGDVSKGVDAAERFVRELVSSITTFHARTTHRLFAHYGMEWEREKGELREEYCAVPDTLRIPLSPSLDYLKARQRKKK